MRKVLYLIILGAAALAFCVAPLLAWVPGRMTGGGSVLGTDASGNTIRVTHGFELHCDPAKSPDNLEINWDGGNHFHLTNLTSIACYDDGQSPAPPPNTANLDDLYNGCGVGTFNGQPGYTICFTFTDHGEPGDNDTAQYFISATTIVLNVPATKLMFGNQQVHPEN